jgi:hypothetical protein
MQFKKALDLSFLGILAKEQVPLRKYPVRVLLPCKGPGTLWIRIWNLRVRKNSAGRLNVRHGFKASRIPSLGCYPCAAVASCCPARGPAGGDAFKEKPATISVLTGGKGHPTDR